MEKNHFDNYLVENNTQAFITDIIDGMYDWVRVLDKNDNIIYMNKSMAKYVGQDSIGKKCYQVIGRSNPCKNCVSRMAIFNGNIHEKEEHINDMIFSVMSSPVRNRDGEIVAVVEVLRDITNVRKLQKKIVEQNIKLQNDLDIAKKLQCSLLPKQISNEKLNFSFLYKPCETLGGDFLDIYMIDDKHLGLYIADVSGHGVSASMLTIFLRSAINKNELSPAKVLTSLYEEFNKNDFSFEGMYITLFYSVIDLENDTITYSNAGLNVSPIVFNSSTFELLMVPGIPISDWLDTPDYKDFTLNLKDGDRLFLYTDGIIELKNSVKEQFGEDRLLDILLGDKSSPSIILNRIIKTACEFATITNPSQAPDDITIMLIEYGKLEN